MLKYRLILLFFLFGMMLHAENFVFQNISTRDGLSHNDVNCIIKDKQGFMWFGTNDGLNCYDGYEFEIYRYNADGGKGLSSDIIHTIKLDKDQNIWIGTVAGGVDVINYQTQEIAHITIPKGQVDLLEKEDIREIHTQNDLAIIMTKEKLFFLNTDNDRLSIPIKGKYFLEANTKLINCIYPISESEFIIGTRHGIKFLHLSTSGQLDGEITNHGKNKNVHKICPFRDGYLVACYNDSLYFMNQYFQFTPIIKGEFYSILVENETIVWGGGNSGLERFTFENDSSLILSRTEKFNLENTNGQLGSNQINTIYKDHLGMIWVGTNGGGICKITTQPQKFTSFGSYGSESEPRANYINCFLEDSDNNLWVGNCNGNIYYYRSGNHKYDSTSADFVKQISKKISYIKFIEIQILGKKYIVACTDYPYEVQVFKKQGIPVTDIPLYERLRSLNRPIKTMVADEEYLWIGTREGGLYRYHYLKDELDRFLVNGTPTLCSNLINDLYIDSNKNLWIATDKGLNVLFPEERKKLNPVFKRYTHSEKDIRSISHNIILSTLESSNNEIWVATRGGGLNKFDPETDSFSRITTKDGLAGNNIKGMLEDNSHQLWISSNNGISCLNMAANKIINYGISDGLQDYEFRENVCLKRRNGEMLFGGNKGISSFFPDQIEVDSSMPNLVFTGLNVVGPSDNEDVVFNHAQLADFADSSNPIQLKYNENSFTAYFSALPYFAPEEVNYKYRLSGFDSGWISSSAQSRFAKYTNLHPGEYILEVLATNTDGVWLNKPLRLRIDISKAWYASNFAYTIYLLIIIAGFVFFNRYSIIKNNIKHELLMERSKKEKVEQLSQLKLRFFTNISHELRTPISVIKSYFEEIAPNWRNLPEDKLSKDISIISRNVNSLYLLVSQLLDFRKLEQNKMAINPREANIAELIQTILDSFNLLADTKNIDLGFSMDRENVTFWYDPDLMEKIINNLLSNAVKNTPQGGKIEVRVTELHDEIKIEIKDSGVGIPKHVEQRIFERFYQVNSVIDSTGSTGIGLSLTKELIELHQGRIEAESTEGVGSNFLLFFKKGNSHFQDLELQPKKSEEKTILIESDNHELEGEEIRIQAQAFSEKSILVVEDNADLRFFLAEKLIQLFKVDTAENGKTGLEKCIENTPDLVISDIMMPEMNGYELCNAIKNEESVSHIPVILLTAKANFESELHGFRLGADAYVGKPFNFDVLVARIVAILNSRQKIWKRIGENPFFSPEEVTFTAKDEQFLHKVTTIIENHMSNPDFSVEQLADEYAISKINLNNKIKALTGKTSVQFIRLARLRRAAELLKAEHSRVSDVTYDVGYSDLQHFRTHFKKEFSITPSQYKKKFSSK